MATKKLNGESYTCTPKGDKVYCETGNNKVTTNKGNDKVYGGAGVDTIIIDANDLDGTLGKDVLYNLTSADPVTFAHGISMFDEFKKSGNNLVIASYKYNQGKRTNKILDSVTIADYFKPDKDKSINEKDRVNTLYNTKNTKTTFTNQVIEVDLKGTQNLGKGKFNLNTKKSNSKVVLDKTSTANIVFEPEKMVSHNKDYSKMVIKSQAPHDGYLIKKGNDLTLRYDNLTIKLNKGQEKVSAKTNSITFTDYFTTDTSSSGRGNSKVAINNINYEINDHSYTLKELIKDCAILITASDLKEGDLYRFDSIDKSIIDTTYFVTGSKKGDRITLNNTKENMVDSRGGDDIVHSEKNNSKTMFFYSGGADNYIAGTNNDLYFVGTTIKSIEKEKFKNVGFTKKSSLLVNDKGGSEDIMNISAKTKDLRLFFDVNSSGKIVVSEKMDFLRSDGKIWDSLLIFNKSSLSGKNIQSMMKKGAFTGAVEIDNYFATGSSSLSPVDKTTRGAGCIENIETKDSNDELKMQTWINKIAGDVSAWLNANNYSTAGEVLSKENNSSDINALIAIYSKDTYAAAIG